MAKKSYMQALNDALREEMERDPDVFIIGEDVGEFGGSFGVTKGLYDQFGEKRVHDTPITESAIVGAATGSAALGLRPVCELMFADFVGVCMDQLFNQAAKMRYMFGGKAQIPMVLRAPQGGGIGAGPQHSQSLEAWFMHIPGLKVVLPATPADAYGLLLTSIRDNDPVVFLEHKMLYGVEGEVPDDQGPIPFGKANICREGDDVTIVALSKMVYDALEAADTLAADGIKAEVIDPRTVTPLDTETIINSVKKTHNLVIVHEAVKTGGVGAEISAMIAENAVEYLDAPIMRVAAPFTPVPFSPALEEVYLPNAEKIVDAVKKMQTSF